ncbi:hypothetical protein MMC11_005379 [Xylographa trunciseda]|nr:hypothetical protein [Xylographa trunciseda]
MFLNKTRGKVALPVCYDLFARYPSPESLANANFEELSGMIHELGLQNQRAERMIKLAQMWVQHPPTAGQRYRMLHYPARNDGRDVPKGNDPIDDEDPRIAWEIAHLPGTGAYAMDSWRIFCRDELRGLPTGIREDLNTESIEIELQQEWTRVLPLDKELRAYLRWRWLRLGWAWDPVTGERKKMDEEACREVKNGGIAIECEDTSWILEGVKETNGEGVAGFEDQLDNGNEMTDGHTLMEETDPESQPNEELAERQAVAEIQTTNELGVRSDALDANEIASDNSDCTPEAVRIALRWLQESTPKDQLQADMTRSLDRNGTAVSDGPMAEQHLVESDGPLC